MKLRNASKEAGVPCVNSENLMADSWVGIRRC